MPRSHGIHHITAIASDPQRNLDFYVGVLGLRLVKRTVNFDDPRTHHFYYGDDLGRPGTILTFFPWPNAVRGTTGPGSALSLAFALPTDGARVWEQRLRALGVTIDATGDDDGQRFINLRDPDGLAVRLIECPAAADRRCWSPEGITEAMALRGLYSVTLGVRDLERTVAFFESLAGMSVVVRSERSVMMRAEDPVPGRYIIVERSEGPEPKLGAGSIHHVALRTPDRAGLDAWRDAILEQRHDVSPVMNRSYFESIYFPSPEGLLFEVATDVPGFTADETADHLGEALMLPPRYEARRSVIEARIPKVEPPAGPLPY